ncbi:MAG: fibronectin type III domain-containing protein, partial [Thermoguttaceae bacterium]|nr:fibronectin type III domain-containing protein [Thermoguttaceae bacterium]
MDSPVVKTTLTEPTVSTRALASDALFVEWDANPRATGYEVLYRKSSEAEYATVDVAASEKSLILADLESNTEYCVRVRALGDGVFWENSPYCAEQTVATKNS